MTLKEIAELAGVSSAAVSMVLNNKPGISQKKRQEILNLLQKYHYGPFKNMPVAAKGLLFLKFIKNGFLVEENTGFVAAILDSIEAECRRCGYTLRIEISHNALDTTLQNIDFSLLSGIFVLGTELDSTTYPLLGRIPVPYVVIDNRMPHFPCNSITMNNQEMVYSAVSHLAALGFKDIGYFKSQMSIQNFEDRSQAFYDACRKFNLTCAPEHIFHLEPTLLGSYADMKRYCSTEGFSLPPCAFADNDTIAIGAMKALTELGYQIPSSLRIIGFDDIMFSAVNSPSLSTMQVQKALIGKQAVKLLTQAISDHELTDCKQLIGGRLIIRHSTDIS